MDAGKLLANFDLVIAAPGGVARVREMILQLAVRGQLVPPEKTGVDGVTLLGEMRAERARLAKSSATTARKAKPVSTADGLFPIPRHWTWGCLAEVSRNFGQKIPSEPFTYIDVGSIDGKRGSVKSHLAILSPSEAPSRARKIVKPGTVIYSTVRPYLMNIAIIEEAYNPDPIASTAFGILHPLSGMSAGFLKHYLRSVEFSRFIESQMVGIAYPAVSDSKLLAAPVPIPPLAEQKRIVAKVDELMALCGELDEKKQHCDNTHKALQSSALNTLATAATPAATSKAWTRIHDHWPTLLSTPESIATLRQTILQLAIRGQLVPQNPNDESANQRVNQSEKAIIKFVKASRSQKIKYLNADMICSSERILPAGWIWSALGHVGIVNPRNVAADDTNAGLVRMSHISSGYMSNVRYENKKWKEIKSGYTHIANGDVVLAKITPCYENGKSAVINGLPNGLGAGTTELHVFRDVARIFETRFLLAVLKSPEFINAGITRMTGTAGQKRLPAEYFALSPIPIPPLAEQKRIAAKIDELMALCDALERGLTEKAEVGQRYGEAATRPLTEGGIKT